MKLTLRFFRFFIESNFFIAFAAVCMTVQMQIELGLKPQFKPYLSLIFFATLFDYNLHRLNTILFYPESLKLQKYEWVKTHIHLFYAVFFFSCTGLLISLLYMKWMVLLALIPFVLITILYTIPFFKFKNRWMKLRDIPYLKIFIIAFVWSAVIAILPAIESGISILTYHFFYLFALKFIFIFLLTLPFDIRDLEADRAYHLKTLVHWLGVNNSYRLALLLNGLLFLLACYTFYSFHYLLPAYFISCALVHLVLTHKKLKRLRYYHHGCIDGLIYVQAIFVFLSYFLRNLF